MNSRFLARFPSKALGDHLPQIYLLFALPTLLILVFLTPPFQAPDEFAHFYRADSIVNGALLMHGFTANGQKTAGAEVDVNIEKAILPFEGIRGKADHKVSKDILRAAGEARWTNQVSLRSLGGVAVYPPFFYFPQTAAIVLGKIGNTRILTSFYMARLLNGLAAVALSFLALRRARQTRPWLFAILSLPMVSFLYASTSQDALLIAASAWLIARIVPLADGSESLDLNSGWTLVAPLVALFTARPPLIVLGLFLWCVLRLRKNNWKPNRRIQGIILIATLAVVLLWMRFLAGVQFELRPGVTNVSKQLSDVLLDPGQFLTILYRTIHLFGVNYIYSTIGILGWLDTHLPVSYYLYALVAALVAILGSGPHGIPARMRICVAILILAYCLQLLIAMYLSWTPLHNPVVEGVQGRYLLPVLPLLAYMVPPWQAFRHGAAWAAVSMPLVGLPITVITLVNRYYFVSGPIT